MIYVDFLTWGYFDSDLRLKFVFYWTAQHKENQKQSSQEQQQSEAKVPHHWWKVHDMETVQRCFWMGPAKLFLATAWETDTSAFRIRFSSYHEEQACRGCVGQQDVVSFAGKNQSVKSRALSVAIDPTSLIKRWLQAFHLLGSWKVSDELVKIIYLQPSEVQINK